MIITPIDRLIQMIKDFFGNREDYGLPIKKNRLVFIIMVEITLMVLELIPVVLIFNRYYAFGMKSVNGYIFTYGIALSAFGFLLIKTTNKPKIKLRGWLSGKGKFWTWK